MKTQKGGRCFKNGVKYDGPIGISQPEPGEREEDYVKRFSTETGADSEGAGLPAEDVWKVMSRMVINTGGGTNIV